MPEKVICIPLPEIYYVVPEVNSLAKALIFDLDGTLADSLPLHLSTWNKIGDLIGFRVDEQFIREMTGKPTLEFAVRIIRENNLRINSDILVQMKQGTFRETIHLIRPFDVIVNLVRRYYGKLPMAVGTGACRKNALLQLENLRLLSCFDFIVTSDDVIHHKPEPETFLRCAELMKVEPRFCQVFEDGIQGIKAAESAGMMVTDVRPYIYNQALNQVIESGSEETGKFENHCSHG